MGMNAGLFSVLNGGTGYLGLPSNPLLNGQGIRSFGFNATSFLNDYMGLENQLNTFTSYINGIGLLDNTGLGPTNSMFAPPAQSDPFGGLFGGLFGGIFDNPFQSSFGDNPFQSLFGNPYGLASQDEDPLSALLLALFAGIKPDASDETPEEEDPAPAPEPPPAPLPNPTTPPIQEPVYPPYTPPVEDPPVYNPPPEPTPEPPPVNNPEPTPVPVNKPEPVPTPEPTPTPVNKPEPTPTPEPVKQPAASGGGRVAIRSVSSGGGSLGTVRRVAIR